MVKIDFIKVISAALSSAAIAMYMVFIFSLFSEISKATAIYSIIVGVALLLVVPFLPLYYYRELGKIDWDINDRGKRTKFYLVKVISYFIATILFYILNNFIMFKFTLAFLIIIVVLMLVNFYWKISLHSAAITLGVTSLYLIYGGYTYILYILVPFVFWLRIKLKAHNFFQLTAGFIVSLLITFLVFSYV